MIKPTCILAWLKQDGVYISVSDATKPRKVSPLIVQMNLPCAHFTAITRVFLTASGILVFATYFSFLSSGSIIIKYFPFSKTERNLSDLKEMKKRDNLYVVN